VVRYLWACRGRIAVEIKDGAGKVVGYRWKIARDDDPRLTGRKGDRRVLRDRGEIESRRMEARRVILGVYSAARHRVLIETGYAQDCAQAYVVESALHSPGGQTSHPRSCADEAVMLVWKFGSKPVAKRAFYSALGSERLAAVRR